MHIWCMQLLIMGKRDVADQKEQKKTERLHMLISPAELESIDKWRFENRIGTRADAVRRLVQIGLYTDGALDEIYDVLRSNSRESKKAVNRLQSALEENATIEQQLHLTKDWGTTVNKTASRLIYGIVRLLSFRDALRTNRTVEDAVADAKAVPAGVAGMVNPNWQKGSHKNTSG